MIGTMMVGNVFFVIIPAHWKLIRAKEAGREPDPRWNARGKTRSVHNNYLTLPVVFAMLSNHFPFTYGHTNGWLVLVALMAIGALTRHYFNLRHRGLNVWPILVVSAAGNRRARDLLGPSTPAAPPLRADTRAPPASRHRAIKMAVTTRAARTTLTQAERDTSRRGHPRLAVRSFRDVLEIVAAGMRFVARWEDELAPKTVAAFKASLPLDDRIIHCRWSGESNWIPWGDRDFGIGPENATSYPHPGELALYPGGQSETELLFPYGYCSFASKAGHLWANHFATLVEGQEQLKELGRLTLWEGAQQITFREL